MPCIRLLLAQSTVALPERTSPVISSKHPPRCYQTGFGLNKCSIRSRPSTGFHRESPGPQQSDPAVSEEDRHRARGEQESARGTLAGKPIVVEALVPSAY